EPLDADPVGVRGVESLDEGRRSRLDLRRFGPGGTVEELLERQVAVGRGHPVEQPLDSAAELRAALEETVAMTPRLAADLMRPELRGLEELPDLARLPVDEFCAELDRPPRRRRAMSENAAADPIARLEHRDVEPARRKVRRRAEPCSASTDHDH